MNGRLSLGWDRLFLAVLFTASAGAACATEGGGTGGSANLPNRGVQPYVQVEIDTDGDVDTPGEPWVLRPPQGSADRWMAPSAGIADGAVELYWVIRREPPAADEIVAARSTDGGMTWSTPGVKLTLADVVKLGAAPADARLDSPALLVGDASNEWLLAFEFGDRAGIGLARSPNGATWTVDDALLVAPQSDETDIGSPSLVRTAGGLEVFYDATLDDGRRVIKRALSGTETDDQGVKVAVLTRSGVVLGVPSVDCIDAFGEPETCWDQAGVWSPEVRYAKRVADGSKVYRMWFAGSDKFRGDLGFAASTDGQKWSRYSVNPVVESTRDEDEPTNVLFEGRYLLLYFDQLKAGEEGLSLAIDDEGQPSETF